jgi:MinD-like ATPase involved in chromosome partitioning or flagellar assembly
MRIALALPREWEQRLGLEAVRHGHEVVERCTSAEDLERVAVAVRPQVIIARASPDVLTSAVLAACDDAGVTVVALVDNDAGRRHAASLGLFETAEYSISWRDLEQLIDAVVRTADGPQPVTGSVIAVWGPAGSPGRTTLAITIAAELASLGHSVALADVDTHAASVAPLLGMLDEAPGFAAACRLAAVDSLTIPELERIAQRYDSSMGGFWVLTGIGRASRWPELSADRVSTTIALCRTWVEYTVLDVSHSLESDEEIASDLFSPRRNAATIAAVRDADQIVAVGSADPVGLARFVRSHVELLEMISVPSVTVAINRVRASAVGLNPNSQITRTLSRFAGIEDAVLIPSDVTATDGAALSGRTLADAAPKSPARAAIRELVVTRLQSADPHPPRSRRSRKLGRAGTL